MAGSKGKGKQTKRATQRQTELVKLPLLKKPLELIGTQIKVPGSFWDGRQNTSEKSTMYFCTVRDFQLTHVFPANVRSDGFELQEMGPDGSGSHEHGDASGEIFWMEYPFPFLTFYYDTFPDEKPPSTTPAAAAAVQSAVVKLEDEDVELADMHPDFPYLRLSTMPVFG